MTGPSKSVAIIGAGPVGLAAAAHALELGLEPIVLEAGQESGHAVRAWGHVRLFSPWEYNLDTAAVRALVREGWNAPDPAVYPTGHDLVDGYLMPLATRTPLRTRIRTKARVTGISRVGFDKAKTKGRAEAPFEIRYQNGAGVRTLQADAVIDVSGTWGVPNPAGANGLEAIGEREFADRIAYRLPDVLGRDRARYAGKRTAVLGAGHSAIGTLIDLVRLQTEAPATEIVWLLRGTRPEKAFGGGANDKLSARGELGSTLARLVASDAIVVEAGFQTTRISDSSRQLLIASGSACCNRQVIADELIVATGFRPDFSFASEMRLALDPALDCPVALAPLIDPNEHSCGTVRPHGAVELTHPEPGFYVAGMKSYGRAPTFLMMTGYEQVRSIVAEIAGDHEAARRVELVLPETGVCSRDPIAEGDGGCCAPARAGPVSTVDAATQSGCCQ